jgi:hypothetical protein
MKSRPQQREAYERLAFICYLRWDGRLSEEKIAQKVGFHYSLGTNHFQLPNLILDQ